MRSRVSGFSSSNSRLILRLRTSRFIVIISIDRVRSLVTGTIQLTDDNRPTTTLLDIYGNRASNCSAFVVSAKHLSECTIGYRQGYIRVYIGSCRTSVKFGHVVNT